MSLAWTQISHCSMLIPFISMFCRVYLLTSSNCLGKVAGDLIQLRDKIGLVKCICVSLELGLDCDFSEGNGQQWCLIMWFHHYIFN